MKSALKKIPSSESVSVLWEEVVVISWVRKQRELLVFFLVKTSF